jgi:hypothetical protein
VTGRNKGIDWDGVALSGRFDLLGVSELAREEGCARKTVRKARNLRMCGACGRCFPLRDATCPHCDWVRGVDAVEPEDDAVDPAEHRTADWATAEEREVISAVEEHGGYDAAAEATGRDADEMRDVLAAVTLRAAKQGFAPAEGIGEPLPPGMSLERMTVQRRGDGSVTQYWQKGKTEREQLFDSLRKIGDELSEKAPPARLFNGPLGPEQAMNAIVFGDPHVGALSWARETGQDWDCDIAEQAHVGATQRLLARAPAARRCLMVAMGDNLHVNSRRAVTPKSGHLLDVDTRFPNMFDTGHRTIRRGIDAALDTHAEVDVVVLSGNHDPDASFCLAYALASWYRLEPRVRIDLRVSKFRYYVFGRCLLGLAHGDTRKTQNLHGVMLNEWPDIVGRCAHRLWYTGHLHNHLSHTLDDGSIVYQVETLAARDAYAAEGGWATRRSVVCHIWDKAAGRVGELRERIPHHREQKLAPLSDIDGWDPSEGLMLPAA